MSQRETVIAQRRGERARGAAAEELCVADARPRPRALYALLGLMLVLWSSNFVFAKLALREVPPALLICLRTVLAGLFVTPLYCASARGRGVRAVTACDLPRLLGIGVIGIVGNQLLFILAMDRTSIAHGALVGATGPALVVGLAVFLRQEPLSARKVAGLLAAIAGVAVLQLGKAPTGAPSAVGDLLMLGNAALFAAFSVIGKRAASEFGALTLNAVAFWGGGILSLPYAAWGLWRVGPGSIGLVAWTGIVYMAMSSIVGYVIYSYALRQLPASRVSSTTYLQPPLATTMAVLFLGEQPGLAFVMGAAAILGGVWLTQRR